MKQFLFAFILISAPLCAQMTPNTEIVWTPDTWEPPAAKTLQCDKYQHVEHHPAHVDNGCAASSIPVISPASQVTWSCDIVVHVPESPDTCAENTKTVTERQWDDVLSRLKKLEKLMKVTAR
jgi:hypothetical protein